VLATHFLKDGPACRRCLAKLEGRLIRTKTDIATLYLPSNGQGGRPRHRRGREKWRWQRVSGYRAHVICAREPSKFLGDRVAI
jgi:hypothetical protein